MPRFEPFDFEATGRYDVPHFHAFICARNPTSCCHRIRLACWERLVICPACGAAGEIVIIELQVE